MAEDITKKEVGSPASFSYESMASTTLVALANLIPHPNGRIVATIIAAPLGVAIGRYLNWKIQLRKREEARRIVNEEIDDVRKELARTDLSPERREKLNDELEGLRQVRLKHLLLD